MKKTIFPFFLLFALLWSACAGMRNKPGPLAEPADPNALPNILGDYAVNGTDLTDSDYGGTLHIEAGRSPGEYRLDWVLTENIQEGIGHIEGNQLLATWHTGDGTVSGTITYTITKAGQLIGTRTIDGVPGSYRETCYPNAAP